MTARQLFEVLIRVMGAGMVAGSLAAIFTPAIGPFGPLLIGLMLMLLPSVLAWARRVTP